ncbi:MAG TPA: prenyltransferase/squalene oxidase repeat-containing protein [Streptosporangiaceae bacterium]
MFLLMFSIFGSLAPAQALAASPSPTRAGAASGWLARQLTGGSHLVIKYKGSIYPNQGGTIDALLAFAAAGTANGYGARAISWLERPAVLAGYIGNGSTSSFAGATAKLALAAEVRGLDPARFGGVNLPARLARLLTPSGRYSDHSRFGDFSNAFSQALAIIALHRHGGAPAKAVNFLIRSACANGGFPLDFGQKTCVSDPDATAVAAQALIATGHNTAAQRGLRWLAGVQRPDGGFVAAGGAVANANTTGLAGEALAVGRWAHRAARARRFLVGLQAGCASPAARRGAIAFDTNGFQAATAVGATAQGILGLADISLAKLSARGASRVTPTLRCAS